VAALRQADPGNVAPVPVDLVTASASGLVVGRRARDVRVHVLRLNLALEGMGR
jgi:K+-transporting ATPase c subunit